MATLTTAKVTQAGPPFEPTLTELRSLCLPYATPQYRLAAGDGPVAVGPRASSGLGRLGRSALPHQACCRSATVLMELATQICRKADEVHLRHQEEVHGLRARLAHVTRVAAEWEAVFGPRTGVTPRDIYEELMGLRKRVQHLQRDVAQAQATSAVQGVQLRALVQNASRQHD